MPSERLLLRVIRRAGAAALLYLCCGVLPLATPGCYITGDHWTPPTSPDDGKRSSPPKYVQVQYWDDGGRFTGRFWRDNRWYEGYGFVLLNRSAQGVHVGDGWYAPIRMNVPSVAVQQHMYPHGTVVRVDYPLLEDKSLIGKGSSTRVSPDYIRSPGAYGYMVIILGVGGPPDDLPEAYWKAPAKKAR